MHVVILDNGRSRVRETPYRPVLNCIRCGACQNVCPVYRHVGGTAYGWVYGGPIGAVLSLATLRGLRHRLRAVAERRATRLSSPTALARDPATPHPGHR